MGFWILSDNNTTVHSINCDCEWTKNGMENGFVHEITQIVDVCDACVSTSSFRNSRTDTTEEKEKTKRRTSCRCCDHCSSLIIMDYVHHEYWKCIAGKPVCAWHETLYRFGAGAGMWTKPAIKYRKNFAMWINWNDFIAFYYSADDVEHSYFLVYVFLVRIVCTDHLVADDDIDFFWMHFFCLFFGLKRERMNRWPKYSKLSVSRCPPHETHI